LSKDALLKLLIDERSEKELLSNIIDKMPGHVYWLNNRYVYMGCNDIQAKDLGLNSKDEIVGKTIFDLLPEPEAKKHSNINKLVIEKCKVYTGEEKSSMYNGFRTYMSHKLPLTNSAGKNVGLLGISVDITDTKKKEELRQKLKSQRDLYKLAQQVAHDIVSSITSLNMIKYLSAEKLSDREKEMLELSIVSIEEMSNKLIEKYKVLKDEEAGIVRSRSFDRSEAMYINPYFGLLEMIKRYEYRDNKNYSIKYYPDEKNKLVFIRGDYSDFCRMMSNVINNAVEATQEIKNGGEIEIAYMVEKGEVKIRVKENGKGMPKEMAEKLMKEEEIGTTKKEGHGIGTQQIISTIKAMKGLLKIESKENVGTEFIVSFPRSESPRWFADKIELKKGDTVVIVDDEESVNETWKMSLRSTMKK
jgi:PAS domain S-box-containing protein